MNGTTAREFLQSLSLIVASGPHNIFLLRTGARKHHRSWPLASRRAATVV